MKFDTPATTNPIDQLKVIGRPTDRIDGTFKVTGTAPYAYERHDVVADPAYGFVLGAGIAKGRIASMDASAARAAPGVIAVVTTLDTPQLGLGMMNFASLFGGPGRPALPPGHRGRGRRDLRAGPRGRVPDQGRVHARSRQLRPRRGGADSLRRSGATAARAAAAPPVKRVGDFEGAFAAAPVKLDETYTTPDESHAMMEPHATTAAWNGDKLTLWTSNQMIAWGKGSIAKIFGIPAENVRLDSPYIGGGFGGKLFVRADAVLAALGAKAAEAAREGGAHAPPDHQQHHAPAGDDPAHPHRRDAGRQDHRHRP